MYPPPGARGGRSGRCSSGPGVDCRTSTSAACTPRTRRWRCATPATSTPAGVKASRSGWCLPPRSPRPARTRRTRSSIRPWTRRTATRPSTTCPREYRTCEQGLPSEPSEPATAPRTGRPSVRGRRAGSGVVTAASTPAATGTSVLAYYLIGLGDDALVLSHRLAEWITRAPQLEEDIALANISLDLLGQARTLLSYAGELAAGADGEVRSEDDLAYLRDEREFRNLQIVEIGNGDFAVTIARQLIFSAYQFELYSALLGSADDTLAGLAAKA